MRNISEQCISGRMAATVINIFELIDIHEQQCSGVLIVHGTSDCAFQLALKAASIVKTRKRVMIREP